MKLAILGLVTAGIGVAIGAEGLIGIGALWVLLGPVMRAHGQRLQGLQQAAAESATEAGSAPGTTPKLAIDGRTFALGTLLWAALGIPSLVVGLGEIGFDAADADWRWLPIAVGGFAVGIGGVSSVLYALGSAVQAKTGPEPTHPATIRIRSVQETGTFINERPRLEFVFGVEPEPGSGVAAYETTKKATVPFTAMSALKVGDGFKALVAGPEHPTSMEIHWDQPVSGSDGGDVSERLAELEQLRASGSVSDAEYQAQRDRILGSL